MKEVNHFENERTAAEWVEMLKLDHSMADKSDRHMIVYPYVLDWIAGGELKKLVDLGSGEGYLGSILPEYIEYIGIEPSSYLVEVARETYKANHLQYIMGSAYHSGLGDECTHGIVSVMVWFHLQDIDKAAGEMFRILKPEGRFLIITSNSLARTVWESFFQNLKIEANTLIGKFNTSLSSMEESVIYLHPNEELSNSFERAGLQVDRVEPIGIAPSPEKKLFVAISGSKG